MMIKRLLLILFILIVACGGEDTAVTPTSPSTATSEPTVAPTNTPTPIPTDTAVPTNTPVPPTATPIPTATPDPTANFIDFTDKDLGIAMQYPDDWVTFTELGDEDVPIILFTSNEAFVDGPDEGESGALFAVVALDTNSGRLTAVIEDAQDDYEILDDETPVGEATAVIISQQNALRQTTVGDASFGGEYTIEYTVVQANNRNFLFISFAPTGELDTYTPILDAMVASLQFTIPVTAGTVTNDNFTTYTYNNFLAFRYPQAWAIEENIGSDIEVIVSSSQDLFELPPEEARGAAVRIVLEPADDYDYAPGDSLVDTLDNIVVDLFEPDAGVEIVQATQETIINGLPAATTAFNLAADGIAGYVTIALIPHDDFLVQAWGIAIGGAEVEYIPVLDQIFATIAIPASYAIYNDDTTQLSFNYPSHWQIDEIEGGLVVQSDAGLIADDSFPTGAIQFIFWRELDTAVSPIELTEIFVNEFDLITPQEALLAPSAITINGQEAATATYTGEFFGFPVIVRYTTYVNGNFAVESIGVTAVSDINTYQIPQDRIANSIRILTLTSQSVDFTSPVAVVQALFDAAAAENFAVLPELCDPLGENDGDTADLCAITADHALRDSFVEYFANGKVLGEAEIDNGFAEVPFSFGPNNSETETMVLVLRDGLWYLYSY